MIKIINRKRRNSLSEGRNYQIGFAFCKKEDDSKFITVQPISPCKDYLNDVVYTEHTGNPCKAYGLHYVKQEIFNGKQGFIAISMCDYPKHYEKKHPQVSAWKEALKENFKNIQYFLNYFEEKLNLDTRTEIYPTDKDNLYLLCVPYFWCRYTYLISLYTQLVRTGQFYKEGDCIEFFKSCNEIPDDSYIINSIVPKLNKILSGTIPEQDLNNMYPDESTHNMGIVSFNF